MDNKIKQTLKTIVMIFLVLLILNFVQLCIGSGINIGTPFYFFIFLTTIIFSIVGWYHVFKNWVVKNGK